MGHSKSVDARLQAHYGREKLTESVFTALNEAGFKISDYKDTAAFDEFHIRGREATKELAELAGLTRDQRVLDLGCGLGGPSRFLAAEYGCRVVGVDLITEYIRTATALNSKVGLTGRVAFQVGDMCALPFRTSSFDAAWSQHTFMNIEDKAGLLAQVRQVLKPRGRLVLYEILAGPASPIHYPVQWAGDASINFLLDEARFKAVVQSAGFELKLWQEKTDVCLKWFQAVTEKMASRPKTGRPPIGLNLVIGPSTAEKARNTVRNLKENRIRVVYAIYRNGDITQRG